MTDERVTGPRVSDERVSDSRLRLGLACGAAALSALFVVLGFTGIPHTGGDNSGYVALAHGLLTGAGYTDVFDPAGLPHTKYPPLFPVVLAGMIGAGARTWAALKWSAAVPTILTTLLTFLWAERRIGPWAGFGVAAVIAVSSGFVYYSHWVLSDPLFIALTMGALYALDRSDRVGAGPVRWLAVGTVLVGLAYFTRSAGLPLVVALLASLGLTRRWRSLAAVGAGLGLPMLAWSLRGRGEGVAQYGTEFWMVNPYQPELGRIGLGGLFGRIVENGGGYLFQHVPAGIVGSGTSGLALIGGLLVVGAVTGWVLSVRDRVGVVELFVPLYVGLVLLWPPVWGGDRFALPLFPLLLVYAVVAVRSLEGRLPAPALKAVGAIAFLVLFFPAARTTLDAREQNEACAAFAAQNGPWSCYGPRVGAFIEAAAWSGIGLPDGSAVLTRKPRHFYTHGGVPSRAFAFTVSADEQLALADEVGARYVLVDQWDGLAARYVGSAVQGRPGAFCFVRAFGLPEQGGAQLLGILPPEERSNAATASPSGIPRCPDSYVSPGADGASYSSSSWSIPLLDGLES